MYCQSTTTKYVTNITVTDCPEYRPAPSPMLDLPVGDYINVTVQPRVEIF